VPKAPSEVWDQQVLRRHSVNEGMKREYRSLEETTMRCAKCGSELKETSKFCDDCGAVQAARGPSSGGLAIPGAIPVAEAAPPVTAPSTGAAPTGAVRQTEGGFFSFRKMISPTLIKILYVLGMVVITAYGVYVTWQAWDVVVRFGQFGDRQVLSLGTGLVVIVVGNLAWRLICEGAILAFSIHEVLVSIERHMKRSEGARID
jgi:hypothetical protein